MNPTPQKWYFKNSGLVVAFLVAGPLMLPLIWLNPRFRPWMKLLLSAVVLGLIYALWFSMKVSLKFFSETYQQVKDQGGL